MEALAFQTAKSPSKAALWTSRVISVIIILFLLMDSIMKLIREPHYPVAFHDRNPNVIWHLTCGNLFVILD